MGLIHKLFLTAILILFEIAASLPLFGYIELTGWFGAFAFAFVALIGGILIGLIWSN